MKPAPGLEPLIPALEALVRRHPGLRLERKSVAVAIHYRQAPELEGLVHAAVADILRDATGLEGMRGKMVVEIKPVGINKGDAITAFMNMPPFAGRGPVFAGDDVTDEAGFAVIRKLGASVFWSGSATPWPRSASPDPPRCAAGCTGVRARSMARLASRPCRLPHPQRDLEGDSL